MEKDKFLNIITEDVITVTEEATALNIAEIMKSHNIGVVLVLRDKELVGIISERDIVRRIVAVGLPPESVRAQDFMTKDVTVVDLKEGLNTIYETLAKIQFRHLPIMDNGQLIGITSRRDLLDILSQENR